MKIYLNFNGKQGKETVDEYQKQENQSLREFYKYVNNMVKEYRLAGMGVYKSQRCCKNWRD